MTLRYRIISAVLILSSIFLYQASRASRSEQKSFMTTTVTQLGPQGGFIPSIAFHPQSANVVWMAGDDSTGLYKSTDSGQTWVRAQTAQNQSTYALAFAPGNPGTILAPSHFGYGMLKSLDGGLTWNLSQAGLPPATMTDPNIRVYDLTSKPTDPSIVIAATGKGLFKSVDGGNNFSIVSSISGDVRAAVYDKNGILYIGYDNGPTNGLISWSSSDGEVNGGDTPWHDYLPGSTLISHLVVSQNALYMLFTPGVLYAVSLSTTPNPNNPFQNDLTTTPLSLPADRSSTNPTMGFSVLSGANVRTNDTIYYGTAGNSSVASSKWGLFKSTNGGQNWTKLNNGLAGISIFSIAVNPLDPNIVLVGSVNSAGVYRSSDAGASWAPANTGVFANVGFGIAQSKSNPAFMILSSTAGYGFSRTYFSNNSGSTWQVTPEVNDQDGTQTFNIDPVNSQKILAGMRSKGVYRSNSGIGGPWTRVVTDNINIDKIVRDRVNGANKIYLVTNSPGFTTPIYYSTNGGTSFSKRFGNFALHIAAHPTHEGEAIEATYGDVYASTNMFQSRSGIGLAPYASLESGFFTSAVFDDANPKTVYVGGYKGGLYKTTNYTPSGNGVTWQVLPSPCHDATVREMSVAQRSPDTFIYAACVAVDVNYLPTSTPGLYRSADAGQTWTNLTADASSFSSNSPFRFMKSTQAPNNVFYVGTWGGGLLQITEN